MASTPLVATGSVIVGAAVGSLLTATLVSPPPPTEADARAALATLTQVVDGAYAPTPTPTPTPSPSDIPTATPTPTVTVEPSPSVTPLPTGTIGSPALPYSPPVLTNPVTITIAASGGTYTQPSNVDCLIKAPVVITGPVTLNGCDDRVWQGARFGGRKTVPTGSYDSTNRGIRLGDTGSSAQGVDYLEGFLFEKGTYLSDAIQIAHRSTSRTVVIQNVLVQATTIGSQAGVHADTIQCWGGPRTLLVHGLSATDVRYQGVYCDAGDGRTLPAGGGLPWKFTNVNLVGVGDARYLFADRQPGFTKATASNFWISGSKYGDNKDTFGNAPAGVQVGKVVDFVPLSRWDGATYLMPGVA